MVNTEKAIKRNRTRLRRGQNLQQVDLQRMRKIREAKTRYWALRRKAHAPKVVAEVDDKKKKPKKEKKEKKPELEVIEDEPEIEVIDEELEEIYSLDEDESEEDEDSPE